MLVASRRQQVECLRERARRNQRVGMTVQTDPPAIGEFVYLGDPQDPRPRLTGTGEPDLAGGETHNHGHLGRRDGPDDFDR